MSGPTEARLRQDICDYGRSLFERGLTFGCSGNDSVSAGSGADTIRGGDGDDTLAGNDLIEDGLGQDVLSGQLGSDIFDFNAVAKSGVTFGTRDTILEFNTSGRGGAEMTIQLDGILATDVTDVDFIL